MAQYPSVTSETYTPDRLIASPAQIESLTGVLISGQNLLRGSLVGKITASGKFTMSLLASSDGSQVPYGILAYDYNATAGDTTCAIYVKGGFNQNAVIFGTGQTASNTYDALRDAGIYLKPSVSA